MQLPVSCFSSSPVLYQLINLAVKAPRLFTLSLPDCSVNLVPISAPPISFLLDYFPGFSLCPYLTLFPFSHYVSVVHTHHFNLPAGFFTRLPACLCFSRPPYLHRCNPSPLLSLNKPTFPSHLLCLSALPKKRNLNNLYNRRRFKEAISNKSVIYQSVFNILYNRLMHMEIQSFENVDLSGDYSFQCDLHNI